MQPDTSRKVVALAQAMLKLAVKSHWWHLGTKSYAQHQALGSLYGYLHDAADKLMEASIGDGLTGVPEPKKAEMLRELELLCEASQAIKGDPWLENILQDIDGNLYQYQYKIRNLS